MPLAVRLFLFCAISLAILVVYGKLFPPPERPAPRIEPAPQAGHEKAPTSQPDPATPVDQPHGGEATDPARLVRDRQSAIISLSPTDLGADGKSADADVVRFRLKADAQGGRVSSVELPEYGAADDRALPYELSHTGDGAPGLLGFQLLDEAISWEENWEFEVLDGSSEAAQSVRFANRFGQIQVTKTIAPSTEMPFGGETPERGRQHVDVTIEIKNDGDAPRSITYEILGLVDVSSESTRLGPGQDLYLSSGVWTRGRSVRIQNLEAEDVEHWEAETCAWVGVTNNYFSGLFYPITDSPGVAPFVGRAFARSYPDARSLEEIRSTGGDLDDAYSNLRTGFRSRSIELAPGQTVVHRYGLFLSPREKSVLSPYEALGFPEINDYFFLVKLFIPLLDGLYFIAFKSWGLAIILLTVLVKLCLHPVNKKSQANLQRMSKQMQKLKPEMDAIRERHGNNRMKQQEEMQRLFKERGYNPAQGMGGCLMIFLQLPIWFALYSTLGYAFGLRHASFLYIDDLTKPDQLFRLGIDFFGGTFEYFNLLPVLYVIFSVINQRLQPRPEDPQMQAQYKMMTFMLVFFGLIFYAFPSGFMLYIMTSTLLGIIESKIIKAELAAEAKQEEQGGDGEAKVLYPAKGDAGTTPAAKPKADKRSGSSRQRRKRRR